MTGVSPLTLAADGLKGVSQGAKVLIPGIITAREKGNCRGLPIGIGRSLAASQAGRIDPPELVELELIPWPIRHALPASTLRPAVALCRVPPVRHFPFNLDIHAPVPSPAASQVYRIIASARVNFDWSASSFLGRCLSVIVTFVA